MKLTALVPLFVGIAAITACGTTPTACSTDCPDASSDSASDGSVIDGVAHDSALPDATPDAPTDAASDLAPLPDALDGATDALASDAITGTDATSTDSAPGSDAIATDATDAVDAPTDARADTAADAAARDAGDAGCNTCVAETISWGSQGGFIARQDTNTLSPCRSYAHMRMVGATSQQCSNEVAGCPATGALGVADVEAALADPDVVAALASAPTTYGRVFPDVPIYVITVNGRTITLRGACNGAAGCMDPPAGVTRLRTLLDQLGMQQTALPNCSTVFPGG